MVTERGSEYNIVERENSRKMTANGEGGYYNNTEPLGRGGKGIRQIFFDTTKTIPSPPFLGNKEIGRAHV